MTNGDGKSPGPREPGTLPDGKTPQNAARRWDCSVHTIKRAISYGLIATIPFGDRSIIPPLEVARIDREGVPKIPPGYRRKTDGPSPTAKATAKKAENAAAMKAAQAAQAGSSKPAPAPAEPANAKPARKPTKAPGTTSQQQRRGEDRAMT